MRIVSDGVAVVGNVTEIGQENDVLNKNDMDKSPHFQTVYWGV